MLSITPSLRSRQGSVTDSLCSSGVVRPRIVLLVTLVTLIAGSAQALAKGKHPSPKPPTAAQMRAAVQRAERSKYLWATVNICNTKRHPHAIGVRGQMPALGFPALLQMTVHLKYW